MNKGCRWSPSAFVAVPVVRIHRTGFKNIDVSNVTSESDTSREVTPYEVTPYEANHHQIFRYRETEGFYQDKESHVFDLLYKLGGHVRRVYKSGMACLKL